MRASIHDAGDTDTIIISKAKARASILMNGEDGEVSSITFAYSLSESCLFLVYRESQNLIICLKSLSLSFLYEEFILFLERLHWENHIIELINLYSVTTMHSPNFPNPSLLFPETNKAVEWLFKTS